MGDPLSAVDAHVGQHILGHAICGLLQDKCRVLVTHQLHVLHRADRIVWMKDGSIHKIATFPELIDGDLEFQKLMQSSSRKQGKTTELKEVAAEAKSNTISPAKLSNTVVLMQEEERERGSAGLSAYLAFVRASGTSSTSLLCFSFWLWRKVLTFSRACGFPGGPRNNLSTSVLHNILVYTRR
jgi:ATP-binding cassette subfamily C (CFTR/MRP) protein 1